MKADLLFLGEMWHFQLEIKFNENLKVILSQA